jgi:RNA polymerase sigma-70 factor (ECF subfamily)
MQPNAQPEFHELLIAALPHLRAYARSLTGSADQADDLVQDTAVRLLCAHNQYRAGTNFRGWAIATLRNRFIDLRRRARFHGGSIDDVDAALFAHQPSQETVVYFEQTAREFWRLSRAHREIITIIGINGLSYEEAAKLLDRPIGTVRSRLARARAELQGAIDNKHAERAGASANRKQRAARSGTAQAASASRAA